MYIWFVTNYNLAYSKDNYFEFNTQLFFLKKDRTFDFKSPLF